MLVKTKAIVLSTIKFQEKSLIVKCFTLSSGLKSYIIRNAFAGRKVNQKNAYFQPLSILEIEAFHKNKGTLESISEIRISSPFQSIHTDIYKSTMVLFLSEVLHHSIHEEEKNELLFNFLETALLWLDQHHQIANFHLLLLLETTKYLGFYPDVSDRVLPYFALKEGIFTPQLGFDTLTLHQTNLFKILIDLKWQTEGNIFHVIERQILLSILMDYYSFHLDGFKKPKSLAVLKEVFS
ncbi:MAG: repair protein RecO [Bacteroidota bacterium]|nr:repair protein RecO [Bacteroidota bacterium]